MIALSGDLKIWMCTQPTDMRRYVELSVMRSTGGARAQNPYFMTITLYIIFIAFALWILALPRVYRAP